MLSHALSHDGFFVSHALPEVLKLLKLLADTPIKKVSFWMDSGPHFRSREILHLLLKQVVGNWRTVVVNYFAESHGKNPCDQHFSHLSQALKSLADKTDVTTIQHVQFPEDFARCEAAQVGVKVEIQKKKRGGTKGVRKVMEKEGKGKGKGRNGGSGNGGGNGKVVGKPKGSGQSNRERVVTRSVTRAKGGVKK